MMTLNHGFSGYVCGRVAMPFLRRRSPLPEGTMAFAFFLGAMLPDIDIMAKLLGRVRYFSGVWYGHRHASHSFLGTLILSAVFAGLLFWFAYRQRRGGSPGGVYLWLVGCLWGGAILHIFGDLFTPGWPLPLFWPIAARFGAFQHIGWFSPYLLWMFLGTIALAWLLAAVARRELLPRPWFGAAGWLVYLVAAGHWVQFLLTSRYHSPLAWAAMQRELLPDFLVTPVTNGVSFLWFWMTR